MKDEIKVVIRDLVIHKLRRVMRSGMMRNAGIYEIVGQRRCGTNKNGDIGGRYDEIRDVV